MATLTAWKFSTPQGADIALERLQKLDSQQLINVQDAAVVSWEVGRKKPKTRELHDTKKAGALGGGFWGLLFGLIFFVPILGLIRISNNCRLPVIAASRAIPATRKERPARAPGGGSR